MDTKHWKLTAVLLWGIALLLFTGTENLNNLLLHKQLVFVFNPHPDFSAFFNFMDLTKIHHVWIVVKLGHFIGFAIFDLLLFNWLRRRFPTLLLSLLFALATEILQLYLNRDGRLYDVLIDSCGVIAAALLSSKAFSIPADVTSIKK